MKNISETLLKDLESKNVTERARAEFLLGVCNYPEDYWVMPDYYYPGLEMEPVIKNSVIKTSNDRVLTVAKALKTGEKEFLYKVTGENLPERFEFADEKIKFTKNNGEIVEIPWDLFCGIFLKARELKFSRPGCLNFAGPEDEEEQASEVKKDKAAPAKEKTPVKTEAPKKAKKEYKHAKKEETPQRKPQKPDEVINNVEDRLKNIASLTEQTEDDMKIIEERTGKFKLDFKKEDDSLINEVDDNMSLDELMNLYEKKFKKE